MKRLVVLLVALGGLQACQRHAADRAWLGPVTTVEAPATAGSRFPNLAGGDDAPVVMSWLQPGQGPEYTLQYAEWSNRGLDLSKTWETARTVASGADWFVNWADFPSVVPVTDRIWAAHWLQQKPDDVYAYDVRIAISGNGGRRWSAPISPHDDGTPTEHGFVTLLRNGDDRIRAIWLDGRHTPGEHDHSPKPGTQFGAMTLRTGDVDASGRRIGAAPKVAVTAAPAKDRTFPNC